MNPSVKIALYILLLSTGGLFAHLFHQNYESMSENSALATGAADDPEAPAEQGHRASEHYSKVMLYGGLFCVSFIGFAFLFAHDLSNFMGTRALKFLNIDNEDAVRTADYEKADSAWRDGNFLEAIRLLRSYLKDHPREIHALVRVAEIYEKDLKNYLAAAMEYEQVLQYTFKSERWGWLAIRLANIYSGQLDQPEKALELLQRIVNDYGNTKAAEKARQRLALYEQADAMAEERRRVIGVFSKLVSPNVVNELLSSDELNLGGVRQRITVMFADVRGFTRMTDEFQEMAEQFVRENNLNEDQAQAYYNEQARETLATVNLYLSTIADMVKAHYGTLDKYMGDCVMAFWGAPTPNEHHALYCVRAAVDAQRALYDLNQQRADENVRRQEENEERLKAGLPPVPMLALLSLGTGINSGDAIVGLMGSDNHILNYTVFGREVNLASRLEGVSGSGRIIISEGTYQELLASDPELAATCNEMEPVTVKGIKDPVKIYNVPWITEDIML